MKRLFLLLAAVLLLCGCAAEPKETCFGWSLKDQYREDGVEMAEFSDNLEYDYIKWSYNGWYHNREEQADGARLDSWCSEWNLTMTALKEKWTSYIRGTMVLTSMEDYNAIQNAIGATKATSLQNCGAYQEPEEIQRTWEGDFDEAFFEEYDLILIDHCYEGHPFLRSRLDKITKSPGRVTVEMSWETVHAYTADQPGEVYWIIVPKRCGDVIVEYTETAWN